MVLKFWNNDTTVNSTVDYVTSPNNFNIYDLELLKQYRPQVTQLLDGTIVVTYTHEYGPGDEDIFFQRFDQLGSRVGTNTLLTSEAGAAGIQSVADVVALSNGNFVTIWKDLTNTSLKATITDANGAQVGSNIVISDSQFFEDYADENTPVAAALPGGGFITVWDDSGSVIACIVDGNGVAQGNITVKITSQNVDTEPSVTVANGRVMIAWSESTANDQLIHVTSYTTTGVAASPDVTLGTGGYGYETNPSITALSNGSFVAIWESRLSTGSNDLGIRGQVIDANGVKIGAEFSASANIANSQLNPVVTALSNGSFLVVYEDFGGPISSLFAQMFFGDGTKNGSPLLLSDTVRSGQPDVVSLADGRVAVTWTDQNADPSNGGVRLAILDPREGYYVGTANSDTILGHSYVNDYLRGTGGDDVILGLGGDDALTGDDGKDQLQGDAGDDFLQGGAGDDVLDGGAGADGLDGGAGHDAAYYKEETLGIVVALDGSFATGGAATGDVLLNIEDLYGSFTGSDRLSGNGEFNQLVGYGGNDVLYGRAGDDILYGDDFTPSAATGNDTLIGGAGADTLHGGTGNDTASYVGSAAVNVSLDGVVNETGGDAAGDTLDSIENLTGSSFGDTLRGNTSANVISGGSGADIIRSWSGADTVTGGLGADRFEFLAANHSGDVITDFDASDFIVLEGSAFGLGAFAGKLAAVAFVVSPNSNATTAAQHFIFNTANDQLWYDSNGSAAGGTRVMIADLNIGFNLAAGATGDIIIV